MGAGPTAAQAFVNAVRSMRSIVRIVFIQNFADVLGKNPALAIDPISALHLVSDDTVERYAFPRDVSSGCWDPRYG